MKTRNFAIAAIVFFLAHPAALLAEESTVQAGNIKPDWSCHSLPSPPAPEGQNPTVYRWTDEDGNVYYGYSVPDQYFDQPGVFPPVRTDSPASPEGHKMTGQVEEQRRGGSKTPSATKTTPRTAGTTKMGIEWFGWNQLCLTDRLWPGAAIQAF